MRPSNELALSAVTATANGSAIKLENCVAASVHCVSTSTLTGDAKVQISNDPPTASNPTNWSDVSGLTVSITAASNVIIPKFDVSYQWMRIVFTKSGGSGAVSARVKTIGF